MALATVALAAYFANNWPRAPGTIAIVINGSVQEGGQCWLGVTDRSQLNAAFGKAFRGVPKAVRDAHYDLSKIKIQGEPVWHFLQFKGQKVDAHDMADLLRCIDVQL